jgi:hypothetical protein
VGDGLLRMLACRVIYAPMRRKNYDCIHFLNVAVKVQIELPILPERNQHLIDYRIRAVECAAKRRVDPLYVFRKYPTKMIAIPRGDTPLSMRLLLTDSLIETPYHLTVGHIWHHFYLLRIPNTAKYRSP